MDHPQNLTLGNTYFLGIGINAYKHFLPLNNAVKDVTDVGHLLTAHFGFSTQKPYFDLKTDEQATRRNIIKAINDLCHLVQPEDRVLIYYSGHGYLNPQTGLGYWIPVNAENEYIADYVSNSDIRDIIKAMPCRHILLISDSCFSGSLLYRDVVRRTTDNRAFYDWERQASRWVMASGKGVVPDGKTGENSPFAKQLLRHLGETKDKVNINALADKVTTTIQYNDLQQPEASPLFGAGHDGGQFIFYRNGSSPVILTPPKNRKIESGSDRSANTEPIPATNNPINQTTSKMPQKKAPTNLAELKKQLEDFIIADELETALDLLKEHLLENAPLRDDLILLTSRFNSTNKDINRGLVSRENAKMDFARIKYALKDYVNEVDSSDVQFVASPAVSGTSSTTTTTSLADLEREGLLDEATYLQKRINRIKKTLTMETDPSREVAYEEQVKELEEKLAKVKQKL
ncbi:MAG: caspase family protein, partial [Bacteroidota bacterium]